jgi:hypothetical protein
MTGVKAHARPRAETGQGRNGGQVLSIAADDSGQRLGLRQSQALKAVGSLTIREGKAFAGFDENSADEGLSCILLACRTQKAARGLAQTRP